MSSLFKSYRIYLLFIIRKFGKSSSTHFLLAGGSFFLSVMELIFKTGGRRKKCNSKTLVPVSLLYFLRIICHWVLWKNPFLSLQFFTGLTWMYVYLNSFTVCISTLKKNLNNWTYIPISRSYCNTFDGCLYKLFKKGN